MRRIALILCAAAMTVPFSSCGKKDKGEGVNHMYDLPLLGNPASLDPQFADDPSSNTVIRNLYSGLVSMDQNGKITCRNAADYTVSADGTEYKFKLRQDNYWCIDRNENDKIDEDELQPVVADDYVFALRRLLDPKMQSPYAEYFSCIKNGEKIIKGELSPEDAGVYAPDDYSLVITLDYPSSEFLGMLATTAASPCNEEFFHSTKGRYGLDEKSVMSNGAFHIRTWFYDPYGNHNILYMGRNDMNKSETEPICPSHLNFTIEKNEDDIMSLFKDSDIDCFTTLSSSYSGSKYDVESSRAVTLGLVFNNEDKYFRNKDLRKALALSIDRPELNSRVGSDLETAAGIIPPAVNIAGRSYRELSSDSQFAAYDLEEAEKRLEKAKNDLKIGSVDQVKILVNTETVNSGDLHILSQLWQEYLGVYIGIEDVTAEEFDERIKKGEYSLALYPLKGDLNSGMSVIRQFEINDTLKAAVGKTGFTDKLLKCKNVSETVDACTSAEREILSDYGFVPIFYKNAYLVAEKDNEDIFFDPFSGSVDYRIAKNYS